MGRRKKEVSELAIVAGEESQNISKESDLIAKKEEKLRKLRQISKNIAANIQGKGFDAKIGFLSDEHMEDVGKFPLRPTGITQLDNWLNGGVPTGAHMMIYGPPGVGKTSTALVTIAEFQRNGAVCALADAENKFDQAWASKLGVNVDELMVGQFDTSEDMLDWIRAIASIADVIVIDSITGLASKGMLYNSKNQLKDLEEDTMALQARLMFKYFRTTHPTIAKNKNTVILISQVYDTMDQYNPRKAAGGNAPQFFNLLNLSISRSKIKDEDLKDEAYTIKYTCEKGSYTGAPKYKSSVETVFFLDRGFDRDYEIVARAKELGLFGDSTAKTVYTDTDGNIHEFRGSKTTRILEWMKEQNLIEDLRKQI